MSYFDEITRAQKKLNALAHLFENQDTLFAVSSGSEKLDLRGDMVFVALFKYQDHADAYGTKMWPGFYSVHEVDRDDILEALDDDKT